MNRSTLGRTWYDRHETFREGPRSSMQRRPPRLLRTFGSLAATALRVIIATTSVLAAGIFAAHAANLTIIYPSAPPPDIDQQGLTGVWYDPSTGGQGLALEVYRDLHGAGRGYLHGGWFTYDVAPAGGVEKERWYTFSGEVSAGGSTATVPIYLNTGGNLDAARSTQSRPIGTATLSFSSCTSGVFTYAFDDGSGRSGTIPLTRLMPNVTCSTSAERPSDADFSLSGNWFDPSTSGQGFVIEVNPSVPIVFFAWYTYAFDGSAFPGAAGQRWFTAQAPYTPGASSIAMTLYQTTGGIFDADAVPGPTTVPVGMARLVFSSCSSATLSYAFQAGPNSGRFGTIALSRVIGVPAGCVD